MVTKYKQRLMMGSLLNQYRFFDTVQSCCQKNGKKLSKMRENISINTYIEASFLNTSCFLQVKKWSNYPQAHLLIIITKNENWFTIMLMLWLRHLVRWMWNILCLGSSHVRRRLPMAIKNNFSYFMTRMVFGWIPVKNIPLKSVFIKWQFLTFFSNWKS